MSYPKIPWYSLLGVSYLTQWHIFLQQKATRTISSTETNWLNIQVQCVSRTGCQNTHYAIIFFISALVPQLTEQENWRPNMSVDYTQSFVRYFDTELAGGLLNGYFCLRYVGMIFLRLR